MTDFVATSQGMINKTTKLTVRKIYLNMTYVIIWKGILFETESPIVIPAFECERSPDRPRGDPRWKNAKFLIDYGQTMF
jgi:hypothetical protein